MAYNTFERKAYGKIFVEKEEDISIVEDIIRKMDEYEYDNYFNDDLIGVFNPEEVIFDDGSKNFRIKLAYTHKFDSIDLNELQARCWMAGVKVFCWVDGSGGIFPEYKYIKEFE